MTSTSLECTSWYEVYPDADDECIAREDDNYDGPYGGGRCTCGREALLRQWDGRDGKFPHDDFPGCGGCDPVMHDCCPYGFGIELFEDEARCAAVRGTYGCFLPGLLRERDRREIVEKATKVSRRRARAAELRWERIVSRIETHREAVHAYKRWASRTLKTAYRDA